MYTPFAAANADGSTSQQTAMIAAEENQQQQQPPPPAPAQPSAGQLTELESPNKGNGGDDGQPAAGAATNSTAGGNLAPMNFSSKPMDASPVANQSAPATAAPEPGTTTPATAASKRKPSTASGGNGGDSAEASAKKRPRASDDRFGRGKDSYCWICHKEKVNVSCNQCPRSYHHRCLTQNHGLTAKEQKLTKEQLDECWSCLICKTEAEAALGSMSPGLRAVSSEEMNDLLVYAIEAIRTTADASFHRKPDSSFFHEYNQKIIHPMDLETMKNKARGKEYLSVDAFLNDIQWLVHNCTVLNGGSSALTNNAKQTYKLAGAKIVDLETCPDCFKNFHVYPDRWFIEACRRPHIIVWHKLAGYPFWPAKCVRINRKTKEADIRFFGAHDMSWVPIEQCFLITESNCKMKVAKQNKKMDAAMKELNEHIKKVEAKINRKFPYAAEPKTLMNERRIFIPLEGEVEQDDPEWEEELPATDDVDELAAGGDPEDSVGDLTGSTAVESGAEASEDEAPLQIDIKEPAPRKQAVASTPRQQKQKKLDEGSESVSKQRGAKAVGQSKSGEKEAAAISNNAGSSFKQQQQPVKAEPPEPGQAAAKLESVKNEANEEKASSASNVANQEKLPAKRISEAAKKAATEAKISNDATPSKFRSASGKTAEQQDSVRNRSGSSSSEQAAADNVQLQRELDKVRNEAKRLKQDHERQMQELRNFHAQEMLNQKRELEKAKHREIVQMKDQLHQQEQKHRADLEIVKRKQWCANCQNEAIYYCCWNTSYCSYDCQTKHWQQHMGSCQQPRQTQHTNNGDATRTIAL